MSAIFHKVGNLFGSVKFTFKKERRYNIGELCKALFTFLVRFSIFYLAFYSSEQISLKPGEVINTYQYWWMVAFSILSVIVTSIYQVLATKKNRKETQLWKILYDTIEAALDGQIDRYFGPKSKFEVYINQLLCSIEKVAVRILREEGVDVPNSENNISANIMIVAQNPLRLKVGYVGSRLSNRDYSKEMIIDSARPEPGAPEAYCLRKLVYIDNTQSDKYRPYFDENKPYRSFISIPLYDINNGIFGILNVDSVIPEQFDSGEMIAKYIVPAIKPFIKLIHYEQDELAQSPMAVISAETEG